MGRHESLKEWAAREVHEVRDWEGVEESARTGLHTVNYRPGRCRALVARRNEVADTLKKAQRMFLRLLCEGDPVLSDCSDLAALGLVDARGGGSVAVTRLGAEVDRVLKTRLEGSD